MDASTLLLLVLVVAAPIILSLFLAMRVMRFRHPGDVMLKSLCVATLVGIVTYYASYLFASYEIVPTTDTPRDDARHATMLMVALTTGMSFLAVLLAGYREYRLAQKSLISIP